MITVDQFIEWLKERGIFEELDEQCFPEWGGINNCLGIGNSGNYEETAQSALIRGYLGCLHDFMVDPEGELAYRWDKDATDRFYSFVDTLAHIVYNIEGENKFKEILEKRD